MDVNIVDMTLAIKFVSKKGSARKHVKESFPVAQSIEWQTATPADKASFHDCGMHGKRVLLFGESHGKEVGDVWATRQNVSCVRITLQTNQHGSKLGFL